MKNILLIVTSLISITTILGLFLYFSENPKSTIDTYSELDGFEEKGWINTQHLPSSAYDIRIKQNIDTNAVEINFFYNAEDIDSLSKNCEVLTKDSLKTQYHCSHKCEWCQTAQIVIVRLFSQGYGDYKAW